VNTIEGLLERKSRWMEKENERRKNKNRRKGRITEMKRVE
jgi:hypothetical protein